MRSQQNKLHMKLKKKHKRQMLKNKNDDKQQQYKLTNKTQK